GNAGTSASRRGTARRTLPGVDPAQAAGEDVSGDSENHGCGRDQYDLHLGSSVPQESDGIDGRRLGKIMSRDEIQKLLGGYATGTLTAQEQEALFAAALDDQDLFDALAREQSLRDLLRDPAAKAHLLTALDERPKPWWAVWWRPAAVGLTMAGVTTLAVVAVRHSVP